MYELVLDRSTLAFWLVQFSVMTFVFVLSLAGLWLAIFKKRSKGLALFSGLLCGCSIAVTALHTTLSPFSYHGRRLEPAIVVGEELFRRYEEYRDAYGRYPDSIGVVHFPGLDRFDRVEGVREGLPKWPESHNKHTFNWYILWG